MASRQTTILACYAGRGPAMQLSYNRAETILAMLAVRRS
jgi:hypothetical protein